MTLGNEGTTTVVRSDTLCVSGNVGIGTNTPMYGLDVSGTERVATTLSSSGPKMTMVISDPYTPTLAFAATSGAQSGHAIIGFLSGVDGGAGINTNYENGNDTYTNNRGTNFGCRIRCSNDIASVNGVQPRLYFQFKKSINYSTGTNETTADNMAYNTVMSINGNLNCVGINTAAPDYPLVVQGFKNAGNVNGSYFTSAGTLTVSASISGSNTDIGILCVYGVYTSRAFVAASDRRIKTNIVDVDDDRALRDLRLLKPKTYTYKDVVSRGTKPVYGFIAQEVKEVLDCASNYMTQTIPNIYELATFSGDTISLTFNTTDLSRDASGTLFPRIQVKTREGKEEFVNIVEVVDFHTLRVDKDMTAWGGQVDTSGQLVPGNQIFVYGQEVNDFHNLNKDAIWTVATAALQEVDRQLQAEKQKVITLETTLATVLARLDALEQKP